MSSEEEITQISLQLQGLTICVTWTRAPADSTAAAASASGLETDLTTPLSGLGGYPSPDPVCSTSPAAPLSRADVFSEKLSFIKWAAALPRLLWPPERLSAGC